MRSLLKYLRSTHRFAPVIIVILGLFACQSESEKYLESLSTDQKAELRQKIEDVYNSYPSSISAASEALKEDILTGPLPTTEAIQTMLMIKIQAYNKVVREEFSKDSSVVEFFSALGEVDAGKEIVRFEDNNFLSVYLKKAIVNRLGKLDIEMD